MAQSGSSQRGEACKASRKLAITNQRTRPRSHKEGVVLASCAQLRGQTNCQAAQTPAKKHQRTADTVPEHAPTRSSSRGALATESTC